MLVANWRLGVILMCGAFSTASWAFVPVTKAPNLPQVQDLAAQWEAIGEVQEFTAYPMDLSSGQTAYLLALADDMGWYYAFTTADFTRLWPIEGFTASALPVDVVSLDAQRQGAWITWSDLGAGESYFSTRLYYFDGQQVDQLYQVDFSDNYGVCGAQSQRICQGDDIYIQSYWHPTQAPINQYQFLQTRIHYQGIESDALQIKSIQTHIKSLTTQQLQ